MLYSTFPTEAGFDYHEIVFCLGCVEEPFLPSSLVKIACGT